MTPTGNYRGLRAVFLDDGVATFHQLVLEMPTGFVNLPVDWDFDDPEDPGCPCFFRRDRVEGVRFENGYLIVLIRGTRCGPYSEKTVYELGATWCKDAGRGVACAYWDPERQPALGWRNFGESGWRERKPFHISPKGELVIRE
jgi:hypothetical protein